MSRAHHLNDLEEDDGNVLTLGIGQIVAFNGAPKSRVEAVEEYTINPFEGSEREGKGYVLMPQDSGLESQPWRIVNIPRMGPHFFKAVDANSVPKGLPIDPELSGSIKILTKGRGAAVRNNLEQGSILTYKSDDGELYIFEVLDGHDEKVWLRGHPLSLTPPGMD